MSSGGFKFEWQRAVLDSDLPSGVKLVLMVLSTYMRVDGRGAYPTRETIARDASISTYRAGLHIQTAVDTGWITRWERRNDQKQLSGKSAQGWRHYQYAAAIPKNVDTIRAHLTPEHEQNVDTIRAHLTPERGHDSCENVGTIRVINSQVNSQEKTNRESGAFAPDAACAAHPPALVEGEKTVDETCILDNPPVLGKKAGKMNGKRASRTNGTCFDLDAIPEDWWTWADDFNKTHWLGQNVDEQWDKFADHYRSQSGARALKRDWSATWRRWWQLELEFSRNDPRRAAAMEERREAEERHRREVEQYLAQQVAEKLERERRAAEKARYDARVDEGLLCRNCVHCGDRYDPRMSDNARKCVVKNDKFTRLDSAPDCDWFERRAEPIVIEQQPAKQQPTKQQPTPPPFAPPSQEQCERALQMIREAGEGGINLQELYDSGIPIAAAKRLKSTGSIMIGKDLIARCVDPINATSRAVLAALGG